MARTPSKSLATAREFAAHFYLLGCVDFEDCLLVQRRLAYDALSRDDGRIAVLLCEHPPQVTIGRGGSRADVRISNEELAARQVPVRYVGRGGGAILHAPGQLAVYPIVPLAWHGWCVGEFLRRFGAALGSTLTDLKVRWHPCDGAASLRGRLGMLAAVGVSIRNGVTLHGAVLSVHPDGYGQARVQVAPGLSFSSILAERSLPVKMTAVRAALVAHLAAEFGCQRHHLHTGHPHLAELPLGDVRELAA